MGYEKLKELCGPNPMDDAVNVVMGWGNGFVCFELISKVQYDLSQR